MIFIYDIFKKIAIVFHSAIIDIISKRYVPVIKYWFVLVSLIDSQFLPDLQNYVELPQRIMQSYHQLEKQDDTL